MSATDYAVERINVIEIDTPVCSRTFGVSPCNATGEKCFNTSGTCSFRSALNLTETNTYRFCSSLSNLPLFTNGPAGINSGDLLPTLTSDPKVTGATVDLKGGLGVRGKLSCSLLDHPSDDAQFAADPYPSSRTYNPIERGSFWSKLKARDPFLHGRQVRFLSGTIHGGVVDYSDMRRFTYIIESVDIKQGSVSITSKDVLKLADNDRAQYPVATDAELLTGINDTDLSIIVAYNGDDIDESIPAGGGVVRVDDELIQYASRSGQTLNSLTRGYRSTVASSHNSGAQLQLCAEYDAQVHEIIYDMLVNGAGIDPSFIDLQSWELETNAEYPTLLNGIITETTGVKKLLEELSKTAQSLLWWDSESQLIRLKYSKPPTAGDTPVIDADLMVADSFKTADKDDDRISQVWVYYGLRNPTKELDEPSNYELVHVRADLESEGAEEYGSKRLSKVFSRWITRDNKTAAVLLASKLGQRFGKTPRSATFTVTTRDDVAGLSDPIAVAHRTVTNAYGEVEPIYCQVLEKNTSGSLVTYKTLEHPVPRLLDDDTVGSFTLYPQSALNRTGTAVNLRDIYDVRFPPGTVPSQSSGVTYIIESGVEIVGVVGIDTGIWSDLEAIAGYPIDIKIILVGESAVAGIGGTGGSIGSRGIDGKDGGDAIEMRHNLTILGIDNAAFVGAGGGGGGGAIITTSFGEPLPSGGSGGAAYGVGGAGRWYGNYATLTDGGEENTNSSGGSSSTGGAGGDIDQDGASGSTTGTGTSEVGAGGSKGVAINKNGYTLSIQSGASRILGAIV